MVQIEYKGKGIEGTGEVGVREGLHIYVIQNLGGGVME